MQTEDPAPEPEPGVKRYLEKYSDQNLDYSEINSEEVEVEMFINPTFTVKATIKLRRVIRYRQLFCNSG